MVFIYRQSWSSLEWGIVHIQLFSCHFQERERLLVETDKLSSQLLSDQTDRSRLEALIDKLQDDKRRLSQRVNKLTANGRETFWNVCLYICYYFFIWDWSIELINIFSSCIVCVQLSVRRLWCILYPVKFRVSVLHQPWNISKMTFLVRILGQSFWVGVLYHQVTVCRKKLFLDR